MSDDRSRAVVPEISRTRGGWSAVVLGAALGLGVGARTGTPAGALLGGVISAGVGLVTGAAVVTAMRRSKDRR
jgi:uncharacterized membrane protein